MKKLFTFIALLTLVVICAVLFPVEAEAATVESGTCGANLTWTLDSDGTLTISGTGEMENYEQDSSNLSLARTPWKDVATSIKNVVIENGVTSIGDQAFSGCSRLTSVTIPDSITTIGDSAFYGCSKLTIITIPNSVTRIGEYAFYRCSCLASINIPDSVTSIGVAAFGDCTGLTQVHITDLVAWCGINFKRDLMSYPNNPLEYAGNLYLNGDLVTNLIIPDSITAIGYSAFYGCTSLDSVTIPDSVTSIGDRAFGNCDSLTSVTIPDSVTNIGTWTFGNCDSLSSVTIGNGVTSIGNCVFEDCGSLTSITIPDSVTSIDGNAFNSCTSLAYLILPKGMDTIGYSAFYRCTGLKKVFHKGDQADWDWIIIESGNDALTSATIIHNYTGIILGDIDGNMETTQDDAVYLLLHTMFGEAFYPLDGAVADIDGNGSVTQDDAVYLLLHTMFGETFYPLNTPALPAKTKE